MNKQKAKCVIFCLHNVNQLQIFLMSITSSVLIRILYQSSYSMTPLIKQTISTCWHLISYLLVSLRKILGDAQVESNIFLQLINKCDIRCEEDQ